MKPTCYGTAELVLEEATRRFAPLLRVSGDKEQAFKDLCSRVDPLIDSFGCVALEVNVDEETTDISLSLISQDLVLEHGRDNPFFRIVASQDVKAVVFKAEEDELVTTFVLPGIWEKVL